MPGPIRNPHARRLRALVERSGLSHATIAERAGTKASTVTEYVAGRKSPGMPTLARLLVAIGARWADLDEEPQSEKISGSPLTTDSRSATIPS